MTEYLIYFVLVCLLFLIVEVIVIFYVCWKLENKVRKLYRWRRRFSRRFHIENVEGVDYTNVCIENVERNIKNKYYEQ